VLELNQRWKWSRLVHLAPAQASRSGTSDNARAHTNLRRVLV
jgi:hypothetical protein